MTSISTLPIYIGYEAREHKAWEVCDFSIRRQRNFEIKAAAPIALKSENIEEYHRDHGEPQSTDFTFTRFWVPYLCDFKGFSIFVDCDFLFLKHPASILNDIDKTKAVSVVQHPPYLPLKEVKMDGVAQHRSFRKNWASLMVFNNEHPSNKILTPDYLNDHVPGIDFHHLKWLDDSEIGSIPLEWNCLDQYYHLGDPYAIHYTDGGPWFGEEFANTRYAQKWIDMQSLMMGLKRVNLTSLYDDVKIARADDNKEKAVKMMHMAEEKIRMTRND